MGEEINEVRSWTNVAVFCHCFVATETASLCGASFYCRLMCVQMHACPYLCVCVCQHVWHPLGSRHQSVNRSGMRAALFWGLEPRPSVAVRREGWRGRAWKLLFLFHTRLYFFHSLCGAVCLYRLVKSNDLAEADIKRNGGDRQKERGAAGDWIIAVWQIFIDRLRPHGVAFGQSTDHFFQLIICRGEKNTITQKSETRRPTALL